MGMPPQRICKNWIVCSAFARSSSTGLGTSTTINVIPCAIIVALWMRIVQRSPLNAGTHKVLHRDFTSTLLPGQAQQRPQPKPGAWHAALCDLWMCWFCFGGLGGLGGLGRVILILPHIIAIGDRQQ